MSRHRGVDDERYRYDEDVPASHNAAPGLFDPHPDDVHHDGEYGDHGDDYSDRYRDHYSDHPSGPLPTTRHRRREERERKRRARRRRVVLAFSVVVLVALGVGAWQLTGRLFTPAASSDYAGSGTGSVSVTIESGDAASTIGQRLADAGVIKSSSAFVDAARNNSASMSIQPGTYQLRREMSGEAALALLLDPSSRLTKKLTIPEGTTESVVLQQLATTLGVPLDQVTAAAGQIGDLGLPATYTAGGLPTSLEGFLFPATYSFNPGTTPLDALREMITTFTSSDRSIGISDTAAKLGLTPYQVLVAASIAQGEVKNPTDAGKVMRVILNRMAIDRPLQVDPTSAYAAKLAGLDPASIDYATYPSPYNTYLNPGLPPTPIDNPGTAVLQSAIDPPAGDWIYYVTGDADGNLFFTADEDAFIAAAQNCANNNWGCASQTGG